MNENVAVNNIVTNLFVSESFEKELNMVEVSGYKNLHQAADFKPIKWVAPEAPKSNKSIQAKIIRQNSKELFTLTETVGNTPINISEGRIVEVYREIDFPLNILPSTDSIHLFLALQDQKGHNITASKAIYFTVHYNERM